MHEKLLFCIATKTCVPNMKRQIQTSQTGHIAIQNLRTLFAGKYFSLTSAFGYQVIERLTGILVLNHMCEVQSSFFLTKYFIFEMKFQLPIRTKRHLLQILNVRPPYFIQCKKTLFEIKNFPKMIPLSQIVARVIPRSFHTNRKVASCE